MTLSYSNFEKKELEEREMEKTNIATTVGSSGIHLREIPRGYRVKTLRVPCALAYILISFPGPFL